MSVEFERAIERINEFKKNGGPVGQAHTHSSNHRSEIERSEAVGCFYCCEVYSPSLIDEWVDDDTTALCPKCGIDSVVGDASGFPVKDKAFLKSMNGAWF